MRLPGPRVDEHLVWHATRGVPERQRDHDYIIEGADHGAELRDQIDRQQDIEPGETRRGAPRADTAAGAAPVAQLAGGVPFQT